jgi:serine/threonine protein kinase
MRFVHSHGLTHRDLTPDHILLDWDWDWTALTGFQELLQPDGSEQPLSLYSRSHTPECYDETFEDRADVFAFGMILYEIMARRPAFPGIWNTNQIAFEVALKDARAEIPSSVLPDARG